MIRMLLVGWSDNDWKLYRQPQWMAEVRRNPEVTAFPRRHFDVDDTAFSRAVEAWSREESGSSLEKALDHLGRIGAMEVTSS